MSKMSADSLDRILDRRFYQENDVIFEAGDEANAAYIIRTGAVNIVRRSESGDVVLAELTVNQAFGELSLLDNSRRHAAAVAAAPTELMIISAAKFQAKIAGLDPFMRNWVTFLKRRILDLSNRVDA